ncbi:hypothetical protein GSI_08578 [Ganoderma sinense ZZ0214-1]|uniref:Uncharacterized protein n=1 Tax=Ganoderma sinense ZZ0214-1 TaxID=1077348 RepID=A0A2G8S480_9APHY|nr:hypothetical protein GSI_08578 [Ganoderma sinense ZZ0214-1]
MRSVFIIRYGLLLLSDVVLYGAATKWVVDDQTLTAFPSLYFFFTITFAPSSPPFTSILSSKAPESSPKTENQLSYHLYYMRSRAVVPIVTSGNWSSTFVLILILFPFFTVTQANDFTLQPTIPTECSTLTVQWTTTNVKSYSVVIVDNDQSPLFSTTVPTPTIEWAVSVPPVHLTVTVFIPVHTHGSVEFSSYKTTDFSIISGPNTCLSSVTSHNSTILRRILANITTIIDTIHVTVIFNVNHIFIPIRTLSLDIYHLNDRY